MDIHAWCTSKYEINILNLRKTITSINLTKPVKQECWHRFGIVYGTEVDTAFTAASE